MKRRKSLVSKEEKKTWRSGYIEKTLKPAVRINDGRGRTITHLR
jgi:hypothetical protein